MTYALCFYCLIMGFANYKLLPGRSLEDLLASMLVGWFDIPARVFAKMAA